MKSIICTLCLFALLPLYTQAQPYWRVFMKDKGPAQFTMGSDLYNATVKFHSKRALERRQKNGNNPLFTIEDAPVYKPYTDSLIQKGAKLRLLLRWGNYAVIEADSTLALSLQSLPFVKAVQRTAVKLFPQSRSTVYHTQHILKGAHNQISSKLTTPDACGIFRYGAGQNQAAIMNVPEIHAMGITGKNALLTFLDSGFRWKSHKATQNSNVIAEWDFIRLDSITANQEGDDPSQDFHGTICFSTVSAYMQDSLVGIAPDAGFILGKTEDIPTEQHLEEDNYAAAVEWSEALGTDLISSSLGYSRFNQPDEQDYLYSDFDGKTTITARWVNKAVERGVVCITAAGNDGPRDSTLITPADADSVIAVAALTPDTMAAGFTSRGPRGDGAIKPDIAAQGVGVACVNLVDSTGLTGANGTSLATPLIAGVAGLMLSAYPELKPWELKKALFTTAASASAKNTVTGYGLANLPQAMLAAGILISPPITYAIEQRQRIAFYIRSNQPISMARIGVMMPDATNPEYFTLYPTDTPNLYAADIPFARFKGNELRYFVQAEDGRRQRRMPVLLPGTSEFYTLSIEQNTIPCGIDTLQLPKQTTPMSIADAGSIQENKPGFVLESAQEISIQLYAINGTERQRFSLQLMPGYHTFESLISGYNGWNGLVITGAKGILATGIVLK
jgi:hypothetical protein